MAVLHRAHTSGFCSALEQWPHSVALLLTISAAASSVLGISSIDMYNNDVGKRFMKQTGDLKRQAARANGSVDGGATGRRRACLRGRPRMVHSVRAQRSRADETDRSPAID